MEISVHSPFSSEDYKKFFKEILPNFIKKNSFAISFFINIIFIIIIIILIFSNKFINNKVEILKENNFFLQNKTKETIEFYKNHEYIIIQDYERRINIEKDLSLLKFEKTISCYNIKLDSLNKLIILNRNELSKIEIEIIKLRNKSIKDSIKIDCLINETNIRKNKIKLLNIEKQDLIKDIEKLKKNLENFDNRNKNISRKIDSLILVQKKLSFQYFRKLRSSSRSFLENELGLMFTQYDFFDSKWNRTGQGIFNQFEIYTHNTDSCDDVVIDHSTGLMWQRRGSKSYMFFSSALNYITELNISSYTGFKDWRLPTLEEAMSLVSSEKKEGFYIDPIFDHEQRWIWTQDQKTNTEWHWIVYYTQGTLSFAELLCFVRAVRTCNSVNSFTQN